jgi:hypothetical protein
VKGLDKALAEKVRREEQMTRRMQQSQHQSIGIDDTTLDLDEMLEDAYNNNTTQKEEEQELVTSDWRSTKQTRTELGMSMLNYLLQKEKRGIYSSTLSFASSSSAASAAVMNPSAVPIQHSNISSSSTLMVQRSIQQTIYNFALMSNVHQRNVAWEVPQICILSTTTRRMTSGSRRDYMSPLSKDIIMAIKKKLDSRASSSKTSSSLTNSNEKSNNYPSSAFHDDAKTKVKTTKKKKKNSEEETEDPSQESYNDDNINRNGENANNDDSDDDSDIFDNVGTYAPTQQEEEETN